MKYTDKGWMKKLLDYPKKISGYLRSIKDTSEVQIPENPIDQVVFQDEATETIKKTAINKGHIMMVGKPGTGKSMLVKIFSDIVYKSFGEYLSPKKSIIAYPGKDRNHFRIAYEDPEKADKIITELQAKINFVSNTTGKFKYPKNITDILKNTLIGCIILFILSSIGFLLGIQFFMFIGGFSGIAMIFLVLAYFNMKTREYDQQQNHTRVRSTKYLEDQMPVILFDPRKTKSIVGRTSDPNRKSMKGNIRHDPYQSGGLGTPAHKRADLGIHAKYPIIHIDEGGKLVSLNYVPDMLEIMQDKEYILEGVSEHGSGGGDRSENPVKADNIFMICCNHDRLRGFQENGDGAFLSRIMENGAIIHMEDSVEENEKTIKQVAQFIKQEIIKTDIKFKETWKTILTAEGREGVHKKCEQIFNCKIPKEFELRTREFSRAAILEIIKELRMRGNIGELSCLLRPIHGIIEHAEIEAMLENTPLVEPKHVQRAISKNVNLEGKICKKLVQHSKKLQTHLRSVTDGIGYCVGLAVFSSESTGEKYGTPLPVHCQTNLGPRDDVSVFNKTGDSTENAAQIVRASIKKTMKELGTPYIGCEMMINYIQAHNGVDGDSASITTHIGLISDFIQKPVNQHIGMTGSMTGRAILPVGGVVNKVYSIMDPELGMEGACIPWVNRNEIEPLLINMDYKETAKDGVKGITIFRNKDKSEPFTIYFCDTREDAYKIMLDMNEKEVESEMKKVVTDYVEKNN